MDLTELREQSLELIDSYKTVSKSQRDALLKEFAERELKDESPLDFLLDRNNSFLNVCAPLEAKQLSKRIVVIDFFTYCCVNCLHILPHLRRLESFFDSNKLVILGVHSAKFDNERDDQQVLDAIFRYDINHVVINDNKNDVWTKLGIVCWPTLLLLHPSTLKPMLILEGENNFEVLESLIHILMETTMQELGSNSADPVPFLKGDNLIKKDNRMLSYPGKLSIFGHICCVSDTGKHRLIIFDTRTSEVLATVGSGKRGFEDGNIEVATFNSPQGTSFLTATLIYVADTDNNAIRVVNLESKMVATLKSNYSANDEQQMSEKSSYVSGFSSPWDVCVARLTSATVLFVAMAGNHQIWSVVLEGSFNGDAINVAKCVAGSGEEGNRNNLYYPLKATLAQPSGIDFGSNLVVFADSESSSIRCLMIKDEEGQKSALGGVKGLVGGGFDPNDLFSYGDKDGKGNEAKLQHPMDVCFVNYANDKKVVVVDSFNHKLKVVENMDQKKATVRTISLIWDDKDEAFNEPGGVAWLKDNANVDKSESKDNNGEEELALLVADTNNHRVVKIQGNRCSVVKLKENGHKEDGDDKSDYSVYRMINVKPDSKDISLNFEISLPSHLKLSSDAPNKWKAQDTNRVAFKSTKGDLSEPVQLSMIDSTDNNVERNAELKFNLSLFVCDDAKGTCILKTAEIVVEIKIKEESNDGNNFSIVVAIEK